MQDFISTGHQEIDSQHIALEQLIRQLDTSCEIRNKSGSSCIDCPTEHRAACANRLATLSEDLLGFLIRHFSFEDKLMRQLPATPERAQHIGEHKWAHAEIASQVTEEVENFDPENPRLSSIQIQNIVRTCMGAHVESMDAQLVSYLESEAGSRPAES